MKSNNPFIFYLNKRLLYYKIQVENFRIFGVGNGERRRHEKNGALSDGAPSEPFFYSCHSGTAAGITKDGHILLVGRKDPGS